MFSIQDGLDLVLGSFILLLCVIHLYFQSIKNAYYEAASKVSALYCISLLCCLCFSEETCLKRPHFLSP